VISRVDKTFGLATGDLVYRLERRVFLPVLLLLALNVGLAWPGTRYWAAFALLWLLPGLGWAGWLAGPKGHVGVEELTIGLDLGIGTVGLITLWLHYLPGPLSLPMLLVAVNGLVILLAFLSPFPPRFKTTGWKPLLLVIAVAAFFRLLHLGYSEFQGDEGVVVMRAARAILGDGAQLFYHQKGPFEVLLPLATWTLSGTLNEWQARLPFTLAGLVGVAGLYLLGRRLFSRRSSLIAALLLSINGYFVGFGRIVQYQSLVLAATTTALLSLWRLSEGEKRHLIAGAMLLAFGLLAHYDAALALPAFLYLIGRRLRDKRAWGLPLLLAVLLFGGILASFYLPFIRHPNFVRTAEYLSHSRLGPVGTLHNNLLSFLPLATFYNSIYYLASLALLLISAALRSFSRWGLLIPIFCFSGALIVLPLGPPVSLLSGPAFALLLTTLLLSRKTPPAVRFAWLWFGAPFVFYIFLVAVPRTHVLNFFPGASLLAAWALDRTLEPLPRRLRLAGDAILLVFLAFLVYYPYLMFVRHTPEVKRAWPAHRPALYPRLTDIVPGDGYFGFPYRAGWKVVGVLIEEGVLEGTYATNEEPEVTDRYIRGMERTYCPGPDWYFIARDVQDEAPFDRAEVEAEYHLWGEVRVEGETKLWLYRRGRGTEPPRVYHVEDYEADFNAGATPENTLPPPPADYTPAGYTLGNMIRLLGYRLDTGDSRPGGSIHLVLYWEALAPVKGQYQVFNQLYDSAKRGQKDGTPGCGLRPTILWEPGQVLRDEYTIPIYSSTPPGEVPLLLGMYRLDSGERLPVRSSDGIPIGDTILLTTVTVR